MPHSKPSPQSQSDRFKEAARELEADHDGASDKLMGRMAKMKPEPHIKAEPKANEHAIKVLGETCLVTTGRRGAKGLFVALGQYAGEMLEATGKNEGEALHRWRLEAERRGGFD
jgi:hypothetical protein